jgi:hypothetical protein
MVCTDCRNAAAVAREPEVIYQYLDGRDQEVLPGTVPARMLHERCPGGTWCDCQHVIPVRVSAS